MGVDLTEKYTSKKWFEAGVEINPNLAFLMNEIGNYRHLVLQGGSRSGKTYATVQYIWSLLHNYSNTRYVISRESTPALKKSVVKDFIEVGSNMGLYEDTKYNKTDQEYKYKGNLVSFIPSGEPDKLKGVKSDISYINEATSHDFFAVNQITMRTNRKMIYDFNPSVPSSYIYDLMQNENDCAYIKTTFLHNLSFLSKEQIDYFVNLKRTNPILYQQYSLGERVAGGSNIYSHFKKIPDSLLPIWMDSFVVDFGTNPDPTAIIKAHIDGNKIYAKELCYQVDMRDYEIPIVLFFNGYNPSRHRLIADGGGAGKSIIKAMREGWGLTDETILESVKKLGYELNFDKMVELRKFLKDGLTQTIGAFKGNGSIKGGIEVLKSMDVYISEESNNMWMEYEKYAYKTDPVSMEVFGEPIDRYNHLLDALRYRALWGNRLV